MEEFDENGRIVLITVVAALIALLSKRRRRGSRPGRIWMRDWLRQRDEGGRGILNAIEHEIRFEDDLTYRNYLRMSEREFCKILDLIIDDINKNDTVMRQAISARKRLTLTLRYLATGESFQSLSISSRISKSAVSKIIRETLEAINERLYPLYMKPPNTPQEWQKIADEFYFKTGFPNVLGCMDGKHIAFSPPELEQPYYYNYKEFTSMVLLAVVDSNRRFILTDIGANGRASDGGVFANSKISRAMANNSLNFPPPKRLPGRRDPVHYVFLADSAFPLRHNVLKRYQGNGLTPSQLEFNKKLSSVRNVVEHAFGVMANRFQLFLKTIDVHDPAYVELIIKVGCILHNFLIDEVGDDYTAGEINENVLLDYQENINPKYDRGNNVRLEYFRFITNN